jgi:spermidine synthase
MAIRTIVEAVRHVKSTFVKLDCGHERSFGGHVYNGQVQTPEQLKGQDYECVEHMCSRIKSKPSA